MYSVSYHPVYPLARLASCHCSLEFLHVIASVEFFVSKSRLTFSSYLVWLMLTCFEALKQLAPAGSSTISGYFLHLRPTSMLLVALPVERGSEFPIPTASEFCYARNKNMHTQNKEQPP